MWPVAHSSLEQRTIEISATAKVRVTAEAATIKIGFQDQAATKDAAYAENTRAGNKILQALTDTGVPKEAVETETLNLGQDQQRYERAPVSPPNSLQVSNGRSIQKRGSAKTCGHSGSCGCKSS